MKRAIMLLVVLTFVIGALATTPVAAKTPWILSTSSENIWNWHWNGEKTDGAQYEILLSNDQAQRFLEKVHDPAKYPVKTFLDQIDFDKQVAVVAYLGRFPTTGYRVEIGQVDITDHGVRVWLGMQSPDQAPNGRQGLIVAPALDYPFDVVKLSRNYLPEGEFQLEVLNQEGDVIVNKWITPRNVQPQPPVRVGWHTINFGETLWSIARKYGVTIEDLMSANPQMNPNYLWAGQVIRIPMKPPVLPDIKRVNHVVKTGESLWLIANQYGVTIEQVMRWNNITNPNQIWVGQKLFIHM